MPAKEIASNHNAVHVSSTDLYTKACRHPSVGEAYVSDTFRNVMGKELWKLCKTDRFFWTIKKQVDSVDIATHEARRP